MKKTITLALLALAIELHWCFIRPGRKRLAAMYGAGCSLSDRKMLRVNKRVSRHCTRVTVLTERYKQLAGIR